ncbi:MAG: glycosyltransferase family 4 protein [Armatimonadetes bacterium]|nr:glycosyltransferase family 4 protein [Armatimonadota bacterium]
MLQDCSTTTRAGGIWTYIRLLMDTDLGSRYHMPVTLHPAGAMGLNPGALRLLAREMRATGARAAHLHGLQVGGLYAVLAARLAGIRRTVMAVHASEEDNVHTAARRRSLIRGVAEPLTLRLVSAAYCVSEFSSAKPFIGRSCRRFLGCMRNGIPMPSDGLERQAARTALGLPAAATVALFSARLVLDKGILDLAEAWSLLPDALRRRCLLLVAGDGPHRGRLEQQVATLGIGDSVRLMGWRDDVGALLAACDLFVLPSLHENQSYAILEAMAAARPVVSTTAGGTPELVTDGVTGLLAAPADARALSAALAALCTDRSCAEAMGLAGRDRVRSEFTMDRLAGRLADVYDLLLSGKEGAGMLHGAY